MLIYNSNQKKHHTYCSLAYFLSVSVATLNARIFNKGIMINLFVIAVQDSMKQNFVNKLALQGHSQDYLRRHSKFQQILT